MKILFLTEVLYGEGGTEMYLFRLVTHLNKNKFKAIICPLWPQDSKMIQNMRLENIQVKPVLITKLLSIKTLRQAHNLVNYIRKEKIDIIQTHHFAADLIGVLVGRWAGVSVIISGRRDMGFMENALHYYLLRRIMNLFTLKILTNASVMKQHIIKRERIAEKKTATIYNGVPLQAFNQRTDKIVKCRQMRLRPDYLHIGITANIRPIKGLEYFLQAAGEIAYHYPGTEFLIIGGDATLNKKLDDYKQTLNQIISDYEIADRVHFLGRRSDIAEILSILDIYVCASLSEGFSNSIIEAMAMGVPVIATNVGGNAEAVIDGKTGFIVSPRDAGAIAERAVQLLTDRKLAKRMSRAAKRRVVENFSVDRVVSQHEDLYCALTNHKQGTEKTRFRQENMGSMTGLEYKSG
ncbi:glycosyltransferase [candidate division KSB1 bacterium]|nr:glycosyltransferase [candidate division KSB1 bacterium]